MEDISGSTERMAASHDMILELTSEVVSAYVGNNSVATSEISGLISEVYDALDKASKNKTIGGASNSRPAVPIKKSMTDDYLICLEDGKKFKSLKRHLRSHYNISPEEYREKWGLPLDYPMVAPNYAKARSQLARDMGLGRKPGQKIKKKN
jgi:predicted transcriptional regulator